MPDHPLPEQPQAADTHPSVISDPWEQHKSNHSQQIRKSWQFPLDPAHEIGAAPSARGILSPEGDPSVPRIATHASRPVPTPTKAVLEEELRVSTAHTTLWHQVQNWLTLLIWGQQQPQ